jgi:hypothetical protein
MSNLKSQTGLDENASPLLRSDSKAVIHAPVDKIDIPEWLFTLTDEEYQQCSIAHIACAATRSPDDKRMSIKRGDGRLRIDGAALDRGNRGKAALPADLAVRHVR